MLLFLRLVLLLLLLNQLVHHFVRQVALESVRLAAFGGPGSHLLLIVLVYEER